MTLASRLARLEHPDGQVEIRCIVLAYEDQPDCGPTPEEERRIAAAIEREGLPRTWLWNVLDVVPGTQAGRPTVESVLAQLRDQQARRWR